MDSARPLPSPHTAQLRRYLPSFCWRHPGLFGGSLLAAQAANSHSGITLRRSLQSARIVELFVIGFMFAQLETYARKLI